MLLGPGYKQEVILYLFSYVFFYVFTLLNRFLSIVLLGKVIC